MSLHRTWDVLSMPFFHIPVQRLRKFGIGENNSWYTVLQIQLWNWILSVECHYKASGYNIITVITIGIWSMYTIREHHRLCIILSITLPEVQLHHYQNTQHKHRLTRTNRNHLNTSVQYMHTLSQTHNRSLSVQHYPVSRAAATILPSWEAQLKRSSLFPFLTIVLAERIMSHGVTAF